MGRTAGLAFLYVVPRAVTIWSGAADPGSLRFVGVWVMLIPPVIIGYLGHAYWVFRGKVAVGPTTH